MNVKSIVVAIVLSIIIVVAAAVFTAQNPQLAMQNNATNSSKVLFSSSRYFQDSYLIYPGPMSQQSQEAFEGYNLTSTELQNGTTKVKISLVGTDQYLTRVLEPGYKLYILEVVPGDEGFERVSVLEDDWFAVVDADGYIVP